MVPYTWLLFKCFAWLAIPMSTPGHNDHGSDMSAIIISAMMATELQHYQPMDSGQIMTNLLVRVLWQIYTEMSKYLYFCIYNTCTQAFTVILKGLVEDFRSFYGDPPHLIMVSGYLAESTEEDCIGKCPQHTPLGLVNLGMEPSIFCVESQGRHHCTTNYTISMKPISAVQLQEEEILLVVNKNK